MLIKGELDGAFLHDGCASDKVREIFSFTEDFALISSININDINIIDTPIILNSDTNCPYRKLLQKWFAYNNSTIKFVVIKDIKINSLLKSFINIAKEYTSNSVG